jgi:hypothetical protein
MDKIKEFVVKYGRLILDISVAIEVLAIVIYFAAMLIASFMRGSFIGILIALLSSIIALAAIIIFNYLVYLTIDMRDTLKKIADKDIAGK